MLAGALLLSLTTTARSDDPHSTEGAFVRVRGDAFWLAGGRFHFVGTNLAVMHGAERARYLETIVHARDDGAMVGRVWAVGEGNGQESRERRSTLFRVGPEGWNEQAFQHLDRVVAAARTAGMRLVIVLSNAWADYGGVPMMMRWLGHPAPASLAATDAFYQDPRARALFREHVRRVVGRVSSVTNRPNRDEPAIMAWELMNESHSSPEGQAARRDWIREMTAFVHGLDPNHLVTFGALGYRTARERDGWVEDHRTPGVDYCEHHFYAQADVRIRHSADLRAQIVDRVRLAREVVGKPLVIGEIGIRAQEAALVGETRGSLFARFFELARAAGAAGSLAWIYLPPGVPRRGHAITWEPAEGEDADAASSVEVRRAIRRAARRVWIGPDPIGPTGPLEFEPRFQTGTVADVLLAPLRARAGREIRIALAARSPTSARWERMGTTAEVTPAHAYGAEVGHFEWAFALPRARPSSLRVRATVSSERVGADAPEGVTSPLEVSVSGIRIGQWTAPRDDGRGRSFELVSTDATLLHRLSGGLAHLRLAVPDGPTANGLCVYDPGPEVTVRY